MFSLKFFALQVLFLLFLSGISMGDWMAGFFFSAKSGQVTSMLRKEQEEEARLAEKLQEQKYQPKTQRFWSGWCRYTPED